MVSHLVAEDERTRTSEEEIVSGSEGPDVSERVQMAMAISLGARAPIISGHMLNTLRIQSMSDRNVSSGQRSDTFKMYPVM